MPLSKAQYLEGGITFMNVIKRNGEIVPFDGERIVKAINKAFLEVDG